ncbi:MAG: SPOR domain-containing protein [Vicinamibacteraceae bacterium]
MTSDVRALDAGDDGFHEIQLNGKQLVFLGIATTLVSVVIFLCGVLVGRGVKPLDTVAQAAGPQAFDAPLTASVAPGAISTPSPAPPSTPSPSGSGAALAAAAAADAPAGDTEPTPLGDEADAPAPTDVAAATTSTPAKPMAAVQPKAAPKVEPKETAKPKPAPAQATAVPPAVAKPAPAPLAVAPKPTPAPPAPPAPTAVATTAPASAGGTIAVQVGAFNTRKEADALAKRLSGRGYAVYVMNPLGDGKNVFRVRVGNYASTDEAQRVSAKLTSQEKLKPWIIR